MTSQSRKRKPKNPVRDRTIKAFLILGLVIFFVVALSLFAPNFSGREENPRVEKLLEARKKQNVLRVIAYSSFINSWGPGPELAKRFESRAGSFKIEFIDAGDAGLILHKQRLFFGDVVLGLDQLTLPDARSSKIGWRPLSDLPGRFHESPFVAFDWAPMSIVYRKSDFGKDDRTKLASEGLINQACSAEGERTCDSGPPQSLDDLLHPRFKSALALQDPRTSTPGLQFLYWVLAEKGIEEGFKYLEKLRPNLYAVSGSWSSAYGQFQKKQAKLVMSYLTSPVYHWHEDSDRDYQPAIFSSGHPAQVEFAAVAAQCVHCDQADRFVRFLLEPETQKLIMTKNYMLPVLEDVVVGSEFAGLPSVQILPPEKIKLILQQSGGTNEKLLTRWQELGL